jgi:rod shape-determining protein MreB
MDFKKLFSLFSPDIACDLGTANTEILVVGKGIVIREPTICAINKKTKGIVAIGNDAKAMLGKTPNNIVVIKPLKDGVISDYETAEKFLSYYINKVCEAQKPLLGISRPRIVLGVPSGITEVERRAVSEAAISAGARCAFLIEEPMAAALGADLPVDRAQGSMIVDIGGGTTEVAVISYGGIVVAKSLKIAGYEIDQKIIEISKDKYNLLIGEHTAEDVKKNIGNVFLPNKDKVFTIKGRSLKTGLPESRDISSVDIYDGILVPVSQIIESIKDTIEETPPELVADILKDGLTISGGSSLLSGFDKLLSREVKIIIKQVADPATCVVRGCAKVIKDKKLLDAVAL